MSEQRGEGPVPISKIKQTIFGKEKGNCLQTCVAMVLRLPLEEVPNFAESDHWLLDAQVFCLKHGVYLQRRPFYAGEEWFNRVPDTKYWIAEGEAKRGLNHVVVMEGRSMVADPHPDGTGLVKYQAALIVHRISHIQELAQGVSSQQARIRELEAELQARKKAWEEFVKEVHGGDLIDGEFYQFCCGLIKKLEATLPKEKI